MMVDVACGRDYKFAGSPYRDAFVLHRDGIWRRVRGKKRRLRAPTLLVVGDTKAEVIRWLQSRRNKFGRRSTHSLHLALRWVAINAVQISVCATTSGYRSGLLELDAILAIHYHQYVSGLFCVEPASGVLAEEARHSVITDLAESAKREMDNDVMGELGRISSHA